jgi:hypothetical protein
MPQFQVKYQEKPTERPQEKLLVKHLEKLRQRKLLNLQRLKKQLMPPLISYKMLVFQKLKLNRLLTP